MLAGCQSAGRELQNASLPFPAMQVARRVTQPAFACHNTHRWILKICGVPVIGTSPAE